MEPISTIAATVTIANGSSSLLQSANKGVRAAYRRLRLSGTLDPKWLKLGVFTADDASFTSAQVSDIHAFLASAQVRPVLSLLAVGTLLPESGDAREVVECARIAFLSECKRWDIDSGRKWADQGNPVFDSLVELFRGTLPTKAGSEELLEEFQTFSGFLTSPLKSLGSEGAHSAYVAKLVALASDVEALRATSDLSMQLAHLICKADQNPIIGHAEVDTPVSFNDLYVSRSFVDAASDLSEASDGLISSGVPFRVVIMGSPGAGKSTFVNYLTAAMADPALRDPVLPSVVVKCRNYVRDGFSGTIAEYAARELGAELQTNISPSSMDNLLVTGKIAVVFDGLDEVTDLPRRQEMVKRLHRFTSQFPAVSVLVTTREVGYIHAPLSSKVFRSVRLQEFSEDQIEEYCQRWFEKNDRTHLIDHFLADSQAVRDLRANPLLLSLLCILYRDSGAIPANRRGIYRDCAQLLFHKWDMHRQIKQHEVMPDYGDQLMQEIARWIYTSQAAQAGLEEQIIVKSLTTYMVSDLGFMPGKAETAAADFLSFCAGRAWLLGVTGTSKYGGQRIFAFTHRTFYEFFAAEAFARESDGPADIVKLLRSAYERDSTSVLPELLIQCFDQTRKRGATNAFIELCAGPTPPALLLRLMDGATLTTHARTQGFDRIMHDWRIAEDPESFSALLAISGPARDHFQSEYLRPEHRSLVRRKFLYGWASLQLSGTGNRFSGVWASALDEMLDTYAEELASLPDPVIANWLTGIGRPSKELDLLWDYFTCYGTYGWVPGIAWWGIDGVFVRQTTEAPSAEADRVFMRVAAELDQGATFPISALTRLRQALELVQPERAIWAAPAADNAYVSSARNILAYVMFAIAEAKGEQSELIDSVTNCWPALPGFLKARSRSERSKRNPITDGRVFQELLSQLPERLAVWVTGATDLVAVYFGDFDEDDPLAQRFSRDPRPSFDPANRPVPLASATNSWATRPPSPQHVPPRP
jgi:hypothetical protein